MKSILAKKGQVEGLAPAIIALVLASIFLVIGLIILQELRDTDVVSASNSQTITNEIINLTNGTAINSLASVALGNQYPGAHAWSINTTAVTNRSSGVTVPSTNWSLSATGTLGSTGSLYRSQYVNVTYSFVYGDSAYVTSNETLVEIGNASEFWTIIVLALVISIVIGLLLVVFGQGKNR